MTTTPPEIKNEDTVEEFSKKHPMMGKKGVILRDLYFDTSDERSFLIAKLAMIEYARQVVTEQRKLFHDALNARIDFKDESERSNFIIEVMNECKYPEI